MHARFYVYVFYMVKLGYKVNMFAIACDSDPILVVNMFILHLEHINLISPVMMTADFHLKKSTLDH